MRENSYVIARVSVVQHSCEQAVLQVNVKLCRGGTEIGRMTGRINPAYGNGTFSKSSFERITCDRGSWVQNLSRNVLLKEVIGHICFTPFAKGSNLKERNLHISESTWAANGV